MAINTTLDKVILRHTDAHCTSSFMVIFERKCILVKSIVVNAKCSPKDKDKVWKLFLKHQVNFLIFAHIKHGLSLIETDISYCLLLPNAFLIEVVGRS